MLVRRPMRRRLLGLGASLLAWGAAALVGRATVTGTLFGEEGLGYALVLGAASGVTSHLFEQSEILRKAYREWRVGGVYALRLSFYSALIGLVVVGLVWTDAVGAGQEVFSRATLLAGLVVGLAAIAINFVRELHRTLGLPTLMRLVFGLYRKSATEERLFMFLDLNDSTAIAERLGPERFADFKHAFFVDITEPLLESGGDVYEYVGDEVLMVWAANGAGARGAIRFFLDLQDHVAGSADDFQSRFGCVPGFKAGCHAGRVLASEVGDLKRRVVYSGDALNAASRIVSEAGARRRGLLVSDTVLTLAGGPGRVPADDLGPVQLRGRLEPLRLWEVTGRPS